MATPKQGYYNKAGKRIPGTTTILGRFKESGGLIHWAWGIPWAGLMECRALLNLALTSPGNSTCWIDQANEFIAKPIETWNYQHVRDAAADAGTCAHEMMDDFIHGRAFDQSKYERAIVEKADPAFQAFMAWSEQAKFQVVETEVSLVSEKYQFGGTRDAILIDGRRAIGDWKTSRDIYVEMLLQLGAYGILDEEQGNTIDGGYHLLRFSKQEKPDDPVQFSHHYWSHLDKAREAFLLLRQVYDLMGDLKKLAK